LKNKLHQLSSFVSYWLDAIDEHSLHSPFLYNFYSKVLCHPPDQKALTFIEVERAKLLKDDRSVDVDDFGSGASFARGNKRVINRIAKTSLTTRKFSQLYGRIIDYFSCRNILELGTSLGINTLYLASGETTDVVTFEGSSSLADEAQRIFDNVGAKNISIVRGNIDQTLPRHLEHAANVDFVFIDANHKYLPTITYFTQLLGRTHEHSIIVIDDIHYSGEMEMAWREIQIHARVSLTVDLFRCGIVFLNPALRRERVVLSFKD
jgi:hypothetical protein